MREKTCCFTGHRKLPFWGRRKVAAKLEKTIINLIDRGIRFFGAGGALGFDTLAAQTVLRLKKKYSDIKLILVLPCLTQARGWPTEDVEEYERIKAQADKVIYTAQEYTKGCMHKRNRHLVDHSSVCVCYLTKDNGGTAYTVDYAEKRGLEIINLAYK
ncbi:MAG: SLOG family protein [Dysosmobacter sp.]|nr:SLOG family protein [Dysosmobacter sp.]